MSLTLGVYVAIFAAILLALLMRSRLASQLLLGAAGLFGLFYGWSTHGALAAIFPFLIVIVAGVQVASILTADRSATFSDEEVQMTERALPGMGRAQARRLIDQGFWMDGRVGDVLIHEGQAAGQLYYLAKGSAEVHANGRLVGEIGPGQLVGEATVLGETAAIATVTLTQASRFWCAEGEALNDYLAANPDARHALDHSFTVSLRQKLEAMNRAASPAEPA